MTFSEEIKPYVPTVGDLVILSTDNRMGVVRLVNHTSLGPYSLILFYRVVNGEIKTHGEEIENALLRLIRHYDVARA